MEIFLLCNAYIKKERLFNIVFPVEKGWQDICGNLNCPEERAKRHGTVAAGQWCM